LVRGWLAGLAHCSFPSAAEEDGKGFCDSLKFSKDATKRVRQLIRVDRPRSETGTYSASFKIGVEDAGKAVGVLHSLGGRFGGDAVGLCFSFIARTPIVFRRYLGSLLPSGRGVNGPIVTLTWLRSSGESNSQIVMLLT
jgi:hypothetical protein